MNQPLTFRFNVVLFQEGGVWVAQCLDFDVAAQGESIHEARKALATHLAEHIILAVHHGEKPFDGIPSAPQECWQRFEGGERLRDAEPIFIPPAFMINAMAEDVRVSA